MTIKKQIYINSQYDGSISVEVVLGRRYSKYSACPNLQVSWKSKTTLMNTLSNLRGIAGQFIMINTAVALARCRLVRCGGKQSCVGPKSIRFGVSSPKTLFERTSQSAECGPIRQPQTNQLKNVSNHMQQTRFLTTVIHQVWKPFAEKGHNWLPSNLRHVPKDLIDQQSLAL